MSPLLQYALPAIGVCRTFPRDIVFAPTKYSGLGIKHLFTIQEITRIKDIISHTTRNTLLGDLYRQSLTILLLELGLGTVLHTIDYKRFGPLATTSLIKSSWGFLAENHLELSHNITLPPQRLDDELIMSALANLTLSTENLCHLNRCRLFLRAYWLSDISDGTGQYILDNAWLGRPMHPQRAESWPR
jgi:hypothetical protein